MKKSATVIVLVALALVALVMTMTRRRSSRLESSCAESASPRPVSAIRTVVQPVTSKTRSSTSAPNLKHVKPVFDNEDDEDLPPAEKALKDRIEKALDDENLRAAVSCAEEARTCQNAEIRQTMVDTLGWFGKRALPETTLFLADGDDDVRESACSEWSSAVAEIEDEAEKIATVEMAMNVISDEDFLEDISSEYIGVDEKIAVESLMRIIADGKSEQGVAKAKETYEFVTGDEWQNEEEARRWMSEEYKPSEN